MDEVDRGAALDGGAVRARGVAREGAKCLAGKSSAGTAGHAERRRSRRFMLGGSGKERALSCGTLRHAGSPVHCGEGLGAAEEDTTARVENLSLILEAGLLTMQEGGKTRSRV